ncbi:hypothetical protein LIER_38551 [Lithospermum erythrorhizon]|uniref:Replication protein A1 n=1 Tax=Lithospermum erythrorhizon TaxID=34254 RepID=A0AAV3Q3V0_LITER
MARRSLLIPEITTETRSWTTRITVTEDIPAITCGKNSKMKRYIFTDEKDNQVIATAWDFHIPYLVQKLYLFKVYDITYAHVKSVEAQYRILRNPYQWVLQRDTLIRPKAEVEPNLSCLLSNLTSFREIATNAGNLNNMDIMGVILVYANPTTVITDHGLKNIQRFTFVDMERIPISVTLWGEMKEIMSPILEEAANTLSVVVVRRLSPSKSKFKLIGLSLSAKNSSSFTINPPLELVFNLKSWIDSKTRQELEEFLVDQTITLLRNQLTQGSKKILTLAEIKTAEKNGDYWVKGLLQIATEEQKFFYLGCNNCSAKNKRK